MLWMWSFTKKILPFWQILDTYFDNNCLRAAVAEKKQIKWSLFPWIGTQDQAQGRFADEREIGSFCRLRENCFHSYLNDRQTHRNQAATPR